MTQEDLEFQEIFDQVKDIEGWMGESDSRVLFNYAREIEGLIVEIGSYAGRSTKLLALSSPKSKVVTIEPFILDESSRVRETLSKSVSGLNVERMEERSDIVGKKWNTPIDLLLVDGSHSYDDVAKDIRLFIPHVKGIALFHDYTGYHPWEQSYGVYKAVQDSKLPITVEGGFAVYKK